MHFILAIMSLLPIQAAASADCPAYPKLEWANIEILPTTLQEEGYTIKKLHTRGNCYEIYGKNKVGKHVEIYFDTKTYAIIKAEIEK